MNWFTHIRYLHIRRKLRREIMADFTKLNNSILALDTKVTALLALPPVTVEDPAIQAAIDAASASVDAITAKVEAVHPGL